MSFCSIQKNEIIADPPKNSHCRRAFILGVILTKAEISDKTNVVVSLENRDFADAVAQYISEIYGKDSDIFSPGGRRVLLKFSSPSVAKLLQSDVPYEEILSKKCPYCEGAFLRGIFLASGRVTDPEKEYYLEFSPVGSVTPLFDYLNSLGLSPKLAQRKNKSTVYFRKSSGIEDFFALSAMNSTMFSHINAKIENDIRNNVNRVVNCETNNMGRAGNASQKVIKHINKLMKSNMLSSLPEELELTARLRYDNPDLSLAQLAALHTPAISKPGLSHRLKRIEEFAMKNNKNK